MAEKYQKTATWKKRTRRILQTSKMEAATEQIELCPYKKRKLNEDDEIFCDDQADSIAENFETESIEMIQNGDENKSDTLHDNQVVENDDNKDKENESDGKDKIH